ncbi:hypothetical protein AGIG_G1949 [Arapaima gigas]
MNGEKMEEAGLNLKPALLPGPPPLPPPFDSTPTPLTAPPGPTHAAIPFTASETGTPPNHIDLAQGPPEPPGARSSDPEKPDQELSVAVMETDEETAPNLCGNDPNCAVEPLRNEETTIPVQESSPEVHSDSFGAEGQ